MPKGFPKSGVNKGWIKKGSIGLRTGVVVSTETREKMQQAKLGKKIVFSELHRKHLSDALKGKPQFSRRGIKRVFTPEWIRNMSLAKTLKDRSLLKKSDHQNSGAYYEWRKEVRDRDGHKCKIGNRDCVERLETHHILSWRDHPELRYDVNNGITLCKFHHPLKYAEEKRLSPYFQELIKTQ